MAITPLPAVPLRSDAPATFVTKADAFLGALNLFATEVDAVGVALTLGATNSTSTTSLLIGLGSKSLTVQTGKSYVVGMTVKIASTATGVDWMLGDITSYTTGTGALVVTVVGISGTGTFAAWSISQSATGGAKLGANADITSLSGLTTPLSVAQGGTGSNSALLALAALGGAAKAGLNTQVFSVANGVSGNDAVNFGQAIYTRTSNVTPLPTVSAGTTYTVTHTLGVVPYSVIPELVCLTAEFGYAVGDVVQLQQSWNGTNNYFITLSKTTTTISLTTLSTTAWHVNSKVTFTMLTVTLANWAIRFVIR